MKARTTVPMLLATLSAIAVIAIMGGQTDRAVVAGEGNWSAVVHVIQFHVPDTPVV